MRGFRAQSSSRSSSLSSAACWRPHAQSDTMTGSRLNPSLVAVYSTRRHFLEDLAVDDPVLLHFAQRLNQHLLADVGHQSLQL